MNPTFSEIRERHLMVLPGSYYVAGQCAFCDDSKGCGLEWPCDAAVLLSAIDRLEKRVAIIDGGVAGLRQLLALEGKP